MCRKYSMDAKILGGKYLRKYGMLTVERYFKSDALDETFSKVILFILFQNILCKIYSAEYGF